MKFKPFKIAGIFLSLSATGAMVGNYLWLIGLAQKPASDLIEARIWYAAITYLMAIFALMASREFEQ